VGKISANQEDIGGLSDATQQIAGLLEELTTTVESAEHLTRIGQPEKALRIVEKQRESLFDTVDSISRTVSARGLPFQALRRRTPFLAAAALLAISGVAISVGALTPPAAPHAAQVHLRQAEQIEDPATRLNAIYNAYQEAVKTNPAAVAPGTEMNRDVKDALTKTTTDTQNDPQNQDVLTQAQTWIVAISNGEPLTPPSPAPSPTPTPTPSTPPAPSATPPPPPTGVSTDSIPKVPLL
jgi:hypothetical protein